MGQINVNKGEQGAQIKSEIPNEVNVMTWQQIFCVCKESSTESGILAVSYCVDKYSIVT